jgi:ribulose-phosphate 3-epimerase
MTVNPGFGGQDFIPEVLKKIEFARDFSQKHPRKAPLIQVDGGINPETAKACVAAGANVLVSGTYLFKAEDMREAIASLRGGG